MKLLVVSYKVCWADSASPSGYVTNGGFAFQMRTLADLFDETKLFLLLGRQRPHSGVTPLVGHNLSVVTAPDLIVSGLRRKLKLAFWLLVYGWRLLREIARADAVHTPVPSDVGAVAIMISLLLRKRLFIRYCGNWTGEMTMAEKFQRWLMERFAGGRVVCLATGDEPEPASLNPAVGWVFATTLTAADLQRCAIVRPEMPKWPPRLIIACRQERAKGTAAVIESLPVLRQDFPGIMLDVVGDGGALKEFRALAERLKVTSNVVFHGHVDHSRVIELMQQADLCCYPTHSESFSKVVLEALACGLPIITTEAAVPRTMIENRCGIVLESSTAEAVIKAVRICLQDRTMFRAFCEQAPRIPQPYTLENWRKVIGDKLTTAWGKLRDNT